MTVSRPTYASRESVKTRLDVKLTARADQVVDDAVEAAADQADRLCHRVFYPTVATRYFPWPDRKYPTAWILWLDSDELISVTSLTSGGTAIAAADYLLEPANAGPPFTRIELDRSGSAAFGGSNTPQRDVTVAGTFGYGADEASAGTLAEVLDSSETSVDVSNSAAVGVGDLIRVDSERMLVTDKATVDTGQNTAGALTASKADVSLTVADGTQFGAGETVTVGSERMRVDEITGNVLTVTRAWDGSVLAAHGSGTDVYAPRTLTVARGAYGTTAATHTSSSAVYRHVAPAQVRRFVRAFAEDSVLQEFAGYARVVGSGDNERQASRAGVNAVRNELYRDYARKLRIRSV